LRRLGLQDEKELEELLSLFAHGFHIVYTAKTQELQIVEADPDDDKFIECTVALKAKFVITGDSAVRKIQDDMGIKIVRPTEFLSIFGKPKP
jgi:predicted nucleic acid-binding protein